jgi:hypothetical protein
LIINAHESTIAAIALNQEGSLLATASEKVKLLLNKNLIYKKYQIMKQIFIINFLGNFDKNIQR